MILTPGFNTPDLTLALFGTYMDPPRLLEGSHESSILSRNCAVKALTKIVWGQSIVGFQDYRLNR